MPVSKSELLEKMQSLKDSNEACHHDLESPVDACAEEIAFLHKEAVMAGSEALLPEKKDDTMLQHCAEVTCSEGLVWRP